MSCHTGALQLSIVPGCLRYSPFSVRPDANKRWRRDSRSTGRCRAHDVESEGGNVVTRGPTRRSHLMLAAAGAAMLAAPGGANALVKGFEPMEALKGKDYGKERQRYSDYTRTESGLQYQDLREGTGKSAAPGAQVTVDWDGYTIGYYGRPFEARNKAKGGSFAKDKDFYRFTLGKGQVIPAFEEAVLSMKEGGIRRIVVPVELGYPDFDMNKLGPTPTTFSGQRALDFVLRNQGLIDKTLLFDIELVKVS